MLSALGVTHKVARANVVELTGRAPAGKVPTGLDLDGYLAWHGVAVAS